MLYELFIPVRKRTLGDTFEERIWQTISRTG